MSTSSTIAILIFIIAIILVLSIMILVVIFIRPLSARSILFSLPITSELIPIVRPRFIPSDRARTGSLTRNELATAWNRAILNGLFSHWRCTVDMFDSGLSRSDGRGDTWLWNFLFGVDFILGGGGGGFGFLELGVVA